VCVCVLGRFGTVIGPRCAYTRYTNIIICVCVTLRVMCVSVWYICIRITHLHTYKYLWPVSAYYYTYYNRVTPVLHVFNVFVSVCVSVYTPLYTPGAPKRVLMCVYRMFARRLPDFKFLRPNHTNAVLWSLGTSVVIICVISIYNAFLVIYPYTFNIQV